MRRAALLLVALAAAPPVAAQPRTAAFETARRTFLANRLDEAYALFAAEARADSTNPATHAWYAETARRLGEVTTAMSEAREALRLDPCNGLAHEVVANLFNPQFGHLDEPSYDSTAVHLEASARCEPANGSAWMSLWIQGVRLGSDSLQRAALEGLRASGLVTDPWFSHARWVLGALPQRAIALSAGDIDTYPPSILQAVEGLRTDVAIVNQPLLNMAFYVRHLQRRYGLPLPADLPSDSLDYASERIVAFWRSESAAGRLGRPLAILHSNGQVGAGPGTPQLAGPFWVITRDGPGTDDPAIERALERAAQLDWRGPQVAPHDRSPVRASGTMHPAIMVAYLVAFEAQARKHPPASRYDWVVRFLDQQQLPSATRDGFLDFYRKLLPK